MKALQRRVHHAALRRGPRDKRDVRVVDLLFANPFVTTGRVVRELDVSGPGALNLIRKLERLGWLQEARVSGRGGRITWVASDIMRLLTAPGGAVP